MKIALGADHAGYEMKQKVKQLLERMGHNVVDYGTHSDESVDYPEYAVKVARAVSGNEADFGVTVCWTGNGMSMAANKINGIRSGLVINADMAKLSRAHNNANVLSLASKYIKEDELEQIVTTFLETEFEAGRHERRVDKMMETEKGK